MLGNCGDYADAFFAMVAIPSVIGEMWFALWLLLRSDKSDMQVHTALGQ